MSVRDLPAARAPRRVLVVRTRSLGAVCAASALVAIAMLLGVAFAGSPLRLAGGITIDGVPVGGLTPAAAVSLLERKGASLASAPVTFVSGSKRFSIRPEELGVSPDWAAAVGSAQAEASGASVLRGFRRIELGLFGVNLTAAVKASSGALDRELGVLASKLDRPVRQARVVHRGLSFEVVPGSAGLVLDRAQAASIMLRALGSLRRGAPVELPVSVRAPRVSTGALSTLESRAELAMSAPVTLSVGSRRIVVSPSELSSMLVLEGGSAGKLVVGGARADAFFSRLQATIDRPARGARLWASPQEVHVIPATPGFALNVPLAAAALMAAAERSRDRVAAVSLAPVSAVPTTASVEALGITGLVGSYETFFSGVPNRIHNVELVSRLINATLIAPGATFSFNQTTGARTAAKGFRVAPVIINGELSTGLGGGVCQVSTTVFNAALVAGLPITARTNHALYISHYPLGRDATVDYPTIDLRFVNDTPHWLLLRTFVTSSSLIVSLFGEPQHRRVVFQTQPLTATGKMPIQKQIDRALAPGQQVIVEPGMPPTATSVERWVYAPNGTLLSDQTWYSNYEAVPEVIAVGPHPKPATTGPARASNASKSAMSASALEIRARAAG